MRIQHTLGLCYVAIFNIGTWIFGNLGMFAVQNGISSCDVSVCDISGLFNIAVSIMLCSIMSATVFFSAIWYILLSKTAEVHVTLQFV